MTRMALIAALVLALAGAGCKQEKVQAQEKKAVRLYTAAEVSFAEEARYAATVEPAAQVDLAFRAPGFVESIHQVRGVDGRMRALEAGDAVRAGALLAAIRPAEYRARAEAAEAQVADAEAMRRASAAQVKEAEAALTQAELDGARAQALFGSQAMTKAEFDGAVARRDAARARLEAALAQAAAVGAKARSAEAMRAESRLSLGDTTLAAPFSGVVVARLIERGGTVGPNTPAFTIADLSRVKVGFYVPDTALVNLRTGSPVRVTVEALGGKAFDGAVQSLAPRAEAATRGFRVEALVANPLAELRAGMVAAVAPARPAVQPKVAVPMSALLREGTAEFAVLVFENGAVCRRRVTLGRAQGSLVAVESGLRVGERLVREGLATLAEGDAVQVIE